VLTFVCWKWRRPSTGYQLPAVISYGAHHVNVLQRMLVRHVRIPHRLVCLTDDPHGVECETLPVPTEHAELGGCYRRLWLFSDQAGEVLGDRFVSIDLDVILLDDCTPLFERPEPLVLNAYVPGRDHVDQHYNGGLMMLSAGARPQVWTGFDPSRSPGVLARCARDRLCVGTDQAWIRMVLGKGEARWTEDDGVHDARFTLGEQPPPGAKMVLFAGPRDPSLDPRPWVRDAWQ
jgi:hypothetical protein